MKKTSILFLIFGVILFIGLNSGCDQITGGYLKNATIDTSTNNSVRKILIEDYTGFKCENCPAADVIAHRLDSIYAGHIVVLDVHAGSFAIPDVNHTYDFRTTIGNELDNFFQMSANGNPIGMVSRIGFLASNHPIGKDQWEASFLSLKDSLPMMTITIDTATYSQSSRVINVKITVKYLQTGSTHDNLAVYIAEDSVVQYQLNGRTDIPDYVHNHVLRGSMNGTWGDQLDTAAPAVGAKYSKSYSYTVPTSSDWRPNQLKIIAYIHDFQNSYEVWQVEEAKLVVK